MQLSYRRMDGPSKSADRTVARPGFREGAALTSLIVKESFFSFPTNRNLETAATLAYYGFLSLMPLLLLALFALGLLVDSSEQAQQGLLSLTRSLFPAFNESLLGDLQAMSRERVWGLVAVIALLWSMTPFAGTLRNSLAGIFKERESVSYFHGKARDALAVLAILLLFVGTSASRIYFSTAGDSMGPAVSWALRLAGLVGAATLIALFFKAFAPGRLARSELATGALLAALLLTAIRPLFGLFLRFNPNYGYAFGSLKTVFLLLVWMYYTFAVLLFSAEIMANMRRREALVLRAALAGISGRRPWAAGVLMKRFIRQLGPNEVLFEEGAAGREMFVVAEGEIELSRGGRILRTMKVGDFFGEMSMLNNAARSATARAGSAGAHLAAISDANFATILRENPEIVMSMLRELSLRVKTTTDALSTKAG